MPSINDQILAINREQSEKYVSEESARLRYWAKHPTFIGCIKCMDGRVNFPAMTKTPFGIVKPFRAIGGKFNVWWPSFLGRVRHWTERAISQGSHTFLFVTYHYSASDSHLGCAGWKYDTKAARGHAEKLRDDLSYIFGEELTAVVAGVETDRDVLTLHGPNGDISGETCIGKTDEEIDALLRQTFPQMLDVIRRDITPFLKGNAERVKELTDNPRALHLKDHNERIIAVGQGFDWLAKENLALIINDADPNLAESIRVAGSLINKNLQLPGAEQDEATVFTNIVYRSPGIDYRQAVARSRGLQAFAQNVLKEAYPELMSSGRVKSLTTIKWEPNKKLEVL